MMNANTAAACPARAARRSPRPAARTRATLRSMTEVENARASGVLRPWTMRRLPAALNPTFWPVSGLTNTPLRLPGCAASSGGRPHALGMRRSGAATRWARAFAYRCGGSTGWLVCGAGRLPVSRLTARAGAARASTKTRASVGAVPAASRQTDHRGAAAGRRDRTRRPAARGRGGRHGRFARAGRCAIVCAAFGARVRIARMQLNGKQEAELRLACAVPATVRRPRAAVAPRAPRPPSMPLPQRAGRLRPGKRPARIPADARGERAARRTPGPRGTDRSAVCPRPRASPDPPMPCLSAGPRAARRFVSPAMPRCAPWRAR